MFENGIVALVTPFKNGKIDFEALRNLIEFQIESGADGIVPCGTTGESATLTNEERKEVIEFTIRQVKKRILVIAGAGTNSTRTTIDMVRFAEEAGADGVLLVTPYYNKPTQEGLFEHFKSSSKAINIPVVLYNVPSRTGINLLPETVNKIATECENVIAIKEASNNIAQVCEIIKTCGNQVKVLSGDDGNTLPLLALGAVGVISVAANIVPGMISSLCKEFRRGNIKKAQEIHYQLWELFNALFIETNPIPVKTALYMMGKIENEFRLPLTPMSEKNRERLKKVLHQLKLI